MARYPRSAAILGLLILLAFQAGCMTAMGPPMTFSPGDEAQTEIIRAARQVRVVTAGGRVYRLYQPEVIGGQLRGRESNRLEAPYTVVPLDSISVIRPYRNGGRGFAVFISIPVGLLVVALLTGEGFVDLP